MSEREGKGESEKKKRGILVSKANSLTFSGIPKPVSFAIFLLYFAYCQVRSVLNGCPRGYLTYLVLK